MEKEENSSDDDFDLVGALAKSDPVEQRKARLYILEKNVFLNSLKVSVIDLTARLNYFSQVKFLIACGAIPWEKDNILDYSWEIQHFLNFLCSAFAAQKYRSPETIMTSIIKANRNLTVDEQIQLAINSVGSISFSASIRMRYYSNPKAVLRLWRSSAQHYALNRGAIQTPLYLKDGVFFDLNTEEAVLDALPRGRDFIADYAAVGGWNLFEKALILGWNHVAEAIEKNYAKIVPPGCRLAKIAIDDANPHDTCDVEILFEHSKHVKCWAHYAVIAVRCPKLAEEIDKLHAAQSGAAPAVLDPSRGARLIEEVGSGNIPLFSKRERISVTMKETYSVMKALLQFIYLDFVPMDTWRLFLGDSNLKDLQGAAAYYKLMSLAQSVGRQIRKEPFPCFFKDNAARLAALEQAVASGKGPARPAQKVALPTIAEDFQALLSPLEYPKPEALNRLIDLGADRIITAGGKFVLTFDFLLKTLNPHFARLSAAGMRETRESVIHMTDESYESIWTIVSYIITGRLNPTVSPSAALEVLPLTEYFEITEFARMAEKHVVETAQIDDDIALQLAQFAIDTNSNALLDRCINYFSGNPQSLTILAQSRPADFWSCISEDNLDLIIKRLPGDIGKITSRNLRMMRMNYLEEISKVQAATIPPAGTD